MISGGCLEMVAAEVSCGLSWCAELYNRVHERVDCLARLLLVVVPCSVVVEDVCRLGRLLVEVGEW